MSARTIGELIKPIIAKAVGIGRLQDFLECFADPADRKQWIMELWEGGVLTPEEARLLIEHNSLEAA